MRYAILRGWKGRSRALPLLIRAASVIVNHDIMVLFLGLSAPLIRSKASLFLLL
jgi:hypothetical protein